MKIEIHILQSFPPANLNRDENGMPKSTVFGVVPEPESLVNAKNGR
jgi:CRISPR system Cascade subunit CasC